MKKIITLLVTCAVVNSLIITTKAANVGFKFDMLDPISGQIQRT